MKRVLLSDELGPETPIGGKGRALSALTDAGLPVPPWAVVVPQAFYDSLAPSVRAALDTARDADEVRPMLEQVTPGGEVAEELAPAVARLCPHGELLAVRSSAADEDTAALSFAGQLESFLFVGAADLADRLARVWRSGFGARLIAYRRQAGLAPIPRAPAVLIQRMIDPDVAGVAFSADPVSGRRAIAVVAAVPGLASAIVSGEATADTWRVDRAGQVVERHVTDKRLVHRAEPGTIDGVRREELSAEAGSRPSLDDEAVRRVAALARRAERFFGRPQDIEWAMSGGALYLLQSRPITALAKKADPDDVRTLWDNSNIIESYSGVTTPLTFSFARRAYEEVYRQFCRLMRVPPRAIEDNAALFRCMLGLVRGRVYYNLPNWYRLVALLPGYTFNRAFLEQMIGVRESWPDAGVAPVRPRTGARARDAVRVAATLWGLLAAYGTLGRRIERFYRRLDCTLGTRRPDLSDRSPHALVAYYMELETRLLRRWDAPIVNDFATMFFHGMLRRLARTWGADADGTLANDLLCGEAGIISGEPARRIREMARLAMTRPALVAVLREGPAVAIRREMRTAPELEARYAAYLDRFGDRCMEELKLESSTLHDDPLPLLRAIGRLAAKLMETQESRPEEDQDLERRRRAEARAHAALGARPLRRALFHWVLRNARARVRDRENLRFERTRAFGRARLILVELGRRLAALDQLDDPRDVFYLELDEILSFVQGRATTTDLRGLVALRKAEFTRYRSEPAPADRFETSGILYIGNTYARTVALPRAEGDTLTGLGCCAGRVRGPVRVIRDPRAVALAAGDIIVAERTDPGWVMIFPAAAGLLVERGSLLSHSAIVARELGLPTIVSLAGLTTWLKDGDWIEMDGATGLVVKLARPPEASARVAA